MRIDKPVDGRFMGVMKSLFAIVTATILFCVMTQPAGAIILFGLGNSANLTDPGTGVQFDAVAKVYNTDDNITRGSAIHLGNGYMLTANHVATSTDQSFTFNGVDSFALDTGYTPTQVAAGVDLKVFRLTTVPISSVVTLASGALVAPATMVGWGLGRDPDDALGSTSVAWGDSTTVAKRWALNTPRDLLPLSYDSYDFTALRTVLGSATGDPAGLGDNEGAATRYDSGSGLFQEIGGQWRLIGVAVNVEASGSSVFGDDSVDSVDKGHDNYFAYVSSYRTDILALIPEPAGGLLIMSGALLALRRRRADG
jgi:hypothetical protein